MSARIHDIYRSILSYAGLTVRDDGTIYASLSRDSEPIQVVIDGEELVFPIAKQLNDPNQKKLYFHPFSENFVRGESEVIKILKERIMVRINYVTALLGQYLFDILASPEFHKNLDEKQIELLKFISDSDKTTTLTWSQHTLRGIKNDAENTWVKLYIKRPGVYKGQTYSRVGITTFPFYQELINPEAGKNRFEKLRAKDGPNFKKMMEFIFPDIGVHEGYNYGSRSNVSPYLDALMMTTFCIAERLNDIVETYQDLIPNHEDLLFNTDWVAEFEDLDNLRKDIDKMPQLKGNAGSITVQEKLHPAQEINPKTSVPTPVAREEVREMLPLSTVAAPQYQPQQQQPVIYHQPVVEHQAPAITNANGKINFGEVVRSSPNMQMQPNNFAPPIPPHVLEHIRLYGYPPPGYPMPGQQMQPQLGPMAHRNPSWAAPPVQQGMPMNQQMMQIQTPQGIVTLPVPQPGYQWVQHQQTAQWMQVPMQPQYQQVQPMNYGQPQGGGYPPGWVR